MYFIVTVKPLITLRPYSVGSPCINIFTQFQQACKFFKHNKKISWSHEIPTEDIQKLQVNYKP